MEEQYSCMFLRTEEPGGLQLIESQSQTPVKQLSIAHLEYTLWKLYINAVDPAFLVKTERKEGKKEKKKEYRDKEFWLWSQ